MTEVTSIGAAVSRLTGMRLRLVHSILYSIQTKELLAAKAKSRFSKEESSPYFNKIADEAKKRVETPERELQLDVFLALSKALKLPAARLTEKEKISARSVEIVDKWFEKTAKKEKTAEDKFEKSHVTDKLEFLLHYESVRLLERFMKNEKAEEEKGSLQESIQRYWEQMPEYKKVQIYEHLKADRDLSFAGLIEEKGMGSFLYEMGSRMGFSMYGEIMSSVHSGIPAGMPDYMWILHPDALFTTDTAIKTLLSGSWSIAAAMLLIYLPGTPNESEEAASLSEEWMARENNYLLLMRQINELKVEQQKKQQEMDLTRLELENAVSAARRSKAVYHNLRERLIAILKTDEARPFLGDISVSNTRIREKLTRVNAKIEANQMKQGLLKAAGAWLVNTYLQTEKSSLEKKLQSSFEQMADEVMEKYPYYEVDLIEEMKSAHTTANSWEFESSRLKKKESEAAASLAEMKSQELKLKEKAAESVSKTPGLKQIGAEKPF